MTLKLTRKYILALLLTIACVVVGILCLSKAVGDIKYTDKVTDSKIIEFGQITLTADGGNGRKVPKNTMYAVDDLKNKLFSSMKIDARLTKDKQYAAIEAEDISVITNGKGKVSDYTYFDLMQYNIKGFSGYKNPIIELSSSVAETAYQNGISPMIFIHDYDKTAIKNLLEKLSSKSVFVPYFASDNLKVLKYIEKVDSFANLIYFTDEVTDDVISKVKDSSRIFVCFNAQNKNNNYEKIENLTNNNILYLAHSAETLKEIEKLYKLGVRHFVTDTVTLQGGASN